MEMCSPVVTGAVGIVTIISIHTHSSDSGWWVLPNKMLRGSHELSHISYNVLWDRYY